MPFSLNPAINTVIRYASLVMISVAAVNPTYANPLFSKPSLGDKPGLGSEPEFLAVSDAFQLQSSIEQGLLKLSWQIAPNYFLYHHSLKVETKRDGQLVDISSQFIQSAALRKSDPYFGQVGVYYHYADLSQKPSSEPGVISFDTGKTLYISYQGCAESGLCYPTQTDQIIVNN